MVGGKQLTEEHQGGCGGAIALSRLHGNGYCLSKAADLFVV